jgi:hypothetical protein
VVSIFSKNMNILAASMDKGRREVRDEGLSKREWKAGRKVRIMAEIIYGRRQAGGGTRRKAGRKERRKVGMKAETQARIKAGGRLVTRD